MPIFQIDPFKEARKNAHIWRGENAVIWYNEKLDGSFTILILYEFAGEKRRIYFEVDEDNRKVEFKNDKLQAEQFITLLQDIRAIERMLAQTKEISGSLPF